MDDDEIKAKLRAMWTPELWDKVKAEARAHLEASPSTKIGRRNGTQCWNR